MAATDKQLDDAYYGLMQAATQEEREGLTRFFRANPETARVAIREAAEVLMQVKCIRYDSAGADTCLAQTIKKLAVLSAEHPVVSEVFKVASRVDLANPSDDPLYDPAMKRIVQHRIARVISCLA